MDTLESEPYIIRDSEDPDSFSYGRICGYFLRIVKRNSPHHRPIFVIIAVFLIDFCTSIFSLGMMVVNWDRCQEEIVWFLITNSGVTLVIIVMSVVIVSMWLYCIGVNKNFTLIYALPLMNYLPKVGMSIWGSAVLFGKLLMFFEGQNVEIHNFRIFR